MPKKKIILPARLEVCEDCGMHGRIVLSDGSAGKEVASAPEALAQIRKLRKDGKILEIEAQVLMDQVRESSLPSTPIPAILDAIVGALFGSDEEKTDLTRRREALNRIHLN